MELKNHDQRPGLTSRRPAPLATCLPISVAASIAPLLYSNLKKAAISIAIWLPYLLLSERVNVTYRWRQSA